MPISTIGQNGLNAPITLTSPVINTVTSAAATALTLQSAGTTAITVNTSQNVGIGTTSPTLKFQVSTKGGMSSDGVFQWGNALTGNDRGFLTWDTGIGYVGAPNNLGFSAGGSDRMRILSGGNVLIGKTTAGAGTVGFEFEGSGGALLLTRASNPTALFNRQGSSGTNILFRFQDSDCGTISVNTGSTAYNTSSDYRLKDEVTPMSGGLDKVSALKPVTWKWKSTGEDGQGFIAHELAEVCPQAVHGTKDAVDDDGKPIYQGIDTSFLVATLTAAIQELKTIVDAQAAEIAELKAKVA
jgi:hypothetical protein